MNEVTHKRRPGRPPKSLKLVNEKPSDGPLLEGEPLVGTEFAKRKYVGGYGLPKPDKPAPPKSKYVGGIGLPEPPKRRTNPY